MNHIDQKCLRERGSEESEETEWEGESELSESTKMGEVVIPFPLFQVFFREGWEDFRVFSIFSLWRRSVLESLKKNEKDETKRSKKGNYLMDVKGYCEKRRGAVLDEYGSMQTVAK